MKAAVAVFGVLYVLASMLGIWLGVDNFYVDYRPYIYWLAVLLGPASFLMSGALSFYVAVSIFTFCLAYLFFTSSWKKTFGALMIFLWFFGGFIGAAVHAGLHHI